MSKRKYPGITPAGAGRWHVTVRLNAAGKIVARQKTIGGTLEQARDLFARMKAEIRQGDAAGSLTSPTKFSTFSDFAEFYLARKPLAGGLRAILDKICRDLGGVAIQAFGARFDSYLHILRAEPSAITGRTRTPTTINRYVMVPRMILGFACKRPQRDITGLTENPLTGYEMATEEGRDRVLSDAEHVRLFATMQRLDSPLYWAAYFSQWNPIRRGDLFKLTRGNLDMLKPWIHFYPSKTRKRKPRETCLVCIDSALMRYFQSLPADCPLLFPRLSEGKWKPFGEYKRHWASICREADIPDFHWHDLKHVAETWMLDNGFAERDLMNLGIQYDKKMIDRYYHRSADKGLQKWRQVTKHEGIMKAFEAENGQNAMKIANSI